MSRYTRFLNTYLFIAVLVSLVWGCATTSGALSEATVLGATTEASSTMEQECDALQEALGGLEIDEAQEKVEHTCYAVTECKFEHRLLVRGGIPTSELPLPGEACHHEFLRCRCLQTKLAAMRAEIAEEKAMHPPNPKSPFNR